MSKKYYLALITAVASLGGLLFGFDMAVVSGVLPLVEKQFGLSASEAGWFVSSALVGCIIGVAVSGELSDRFGRKKLLIVSAVFFFLSALGCALMPSLDMVIVSRILGGIGIGIASNVVPLYISEIASAEKRGRLVTYYQFALTFGILVAYLTNAALLSFSLSNAGTAGEGLFSFLFVNEVWRGMFGLGVIPAVIFLIGLFMVPESPRWLVAKGRTQQATDILTRLSGANDASVEAAVASQNSALEKGSYRELFAPGTRKALLIGIFLPLFSQFSGINAIIYYGPRILNDAGISLSNSLISQVILGAANMLFTLVAIWKVDTWGRRPLYIVGTIGATIALFLTGLCFYVGSSDSIVMLLCLIAFLACFAFSIGPLKFVVASEIFPNRIRGRAMAISIMVMWVADAIVGLITPKMLSGWGSPATFWFFGGFCIIAFFIVYRMLPETKGRSLEEIEAFFADEKRK